MTTNNLIVIRPEQVKIRQKSYIQTQAIRECCGFYVKNNKRPFRVQCKKNNKTDDKSQFDSSAFEVIDINLTVRI